MEEKQTEHNLDPKCKNCTKCQFCFFPNHIRSHVNEGRIQVFMNEVEILEKDDGKRMFQCKFIFNEKIKLLGGNREYAMLRAQKTEQQLISSWAKSLSQLNDMMNIGLTNHWWQILSAEEEQEPGRHYLPL